MSKHARARFEGGTGRRRWAAPVVGGVLVLGVISGIGASVAAGSPAAALQAAGEQLSRDDSTATPLDAAELRREVALSRSMARERLRAGEAKEARAGQDRGAPKDRKAAKDQDDVPIRERHYSEEELKIIREDPKPWARQMAFEAGYSDREWMCLHDLWLGESAWAWDSTNPESGAYGIVQALPPKKMASAGPDWRTNPITQMRWGIDYIEASYGDACSALQFWYEHDPHWY
ncbi:hypothetical protein [Janibacter corallicola]|uniref:aggregation-promoting factor C-terminal-like domain-containing protein n=1 Tax=Janibacter corallicola TaxID=415212 RepID=UPI0012ECE9D8|nr:hypothetical protein [Janibacter corallicola]